MTDYVRDEKPADFLLPDSVKGWFSQMYTHLIGGNVKELARLYDKEFAALTASYFKQSPWPEPDGEAVLSLVDEDPVFILLYTQIYYRHMFSKLQPTMEFKQASWDNYVAIFDGLLDGSLELDAMPSQWLFDIVGEFVYQYQSFCQYRAKLKNESEVPTIWTTKAVHSYLHRLVAHSNIKAILAASIEDDENAPTSPSESIKELGYFALICLSRAHVLTGDYWTALNLLKPIDFTKRDQLYYKSYSCHVSVFYHMGFAQLMLGDFAAAIRSFAKIILQVHRNRAYYSKFADYDQVNKLTEKALALVVIATYLAPGYSVEDQVHALLREKFADKQAAIQKGDVQVLTDLFVSASPKFILPSVAAETDDVSKEALAFQTKLFLELVARHAALPAIRSYIKLYRSIEATKLARFRGDDATVESVVAECMHLKLVSELVQTDVHFYLSGELIKVDEQKREQRTGQYFMNQIAKLQRVVESCQE
ncbi:unnamed protein product [Aphanomyces euteiches]|uniref:Eukaryotic translation initiation factor 3 subunit L n=1 Tax=Aphanomyces euteiches TaxID=100861 RepID=A0A6G0WF68_9STRA|nr:hypothetical protein Ae201684_015655 [Aphanomyces euteiches]KAH9093596.1 hypothetical protein Ae201684P_016223 [Aphanomyces euteiches]KAH9141444.1 hypothetical protein AeRB84_014386 [Aphanomyces euteiches]